MDNKFTAEMIKLGILSYKDQQTLFQIAKHCAATAGVPLAGAAALYGLSAGTVVVPGIGAIPGAVAGALAGMFAGTLSCTMMNVSLQNEVKKLVTEQ